MEGIRKLGEVFKGRCMKSNQPELWPTEPSDESWYYSKSERAYYDLLPSKKARIHKKADSIRYRHFGFSKMDKVGCHFQCAYRPVLSNDIKEAISKSRKILELEDNWDEEGSPGYTEATLNRAIEFLTSNALRYWREQKNWIPAPRIVPGPDGSIDLHWKTPQRELLINIPTDSEEQAAYYGDDLEDGTQNAIRGKKLDTSKYNRWILAWLMK